MKMKLRKVHWKRSSKKCEWAFRRQSDLNHIDLHLLFMVNLIHGQLDYNYHINDTLNISRGMSLLTYVKQFTDRYVINVLRNAGAHGLTLKVGDQLMLWLRRSKNFFKIKCPTLARTCLFCINFKKYNSYNNWWLSMIKNLLLQKSERFMCIVCYRRLLFTKIMKLLIHYGETMQWFTCC